MGWDEKVWNRHLRTVRSALVKRDTLMRGGGLPVPVPETELRRERLAWSAKAKANLRRLAHLAEQAPDRARARETVHELVRWYRKPTA